MVNLIFEKSITRDWCLINAELHQESFTKEFKKQLGWGFTDVIYEGKENVITVYYPPAEYISGMRNFILSRLNQDRSWIETQAAIVTEKVDTTLSWMETVQKKKLVNFSSKELGKITKTFIQRNLEIWPRFLVILMFPIQIDRKSVV